jgi:hypothetical protein
MHRKQGSLLAWEASRMPGTKDSQQAARASADPYDALDLVTVMLVMVATSTIHNTFKVVCEKYNYPESGGI